MQLFRIIFEYSTSIFLKPLPTELVLKMMNVQYNNYKTQLCKFWEQEGKCKFNKNCSYAHGNDELRKPYDELPKDANLSVIAGQ